jgi:hypothetical protein
MEIMMSRTYRRTKGDQDHHYYILHKWMGNYRKQDVDLEVDRIRELRRYHSDNGWCMSTPGWWNNLTCTRPLRVMFREFAHNVKHTVDLEDVPPFPNRLRRPWYW